MAVALSLQSLWHWLASGLRRRPRCAARGAPANNPVPMIDWLVGPASNAAHAARPATLSNAELMLRFEGLGGTAQGCEFGVLQRSCGAEPLGLLRWTQMNAESLAEALESRFDGVGTPEQTILDYFTWPTYTEYRTEDRRFLMSMHTWVRKEDKPYDDMFQMICQRLKFLKRKLIDDLTDAEKIFVFKMGDRICSGAQIRRIHAAMRCYGGNTLLYVRTADVVHPPGTVEQVQDGLLIGYIGHFNETPEGQVRPVDQQSWLAVCREAHRLFCDARASG